MKISPSWPVPDLISGLLLFLVYINDLYNERKPNAKLIADEVSLFSIANPIQNEPFWGC